jgi:hypothetical protein
MTHLNNKKRNNTIVTAAKVFSLATILVVAIGVTTMAPLTALGSRSGGGEGFIDFIATDRKAPPVVSGDNIYIAWWTNNTENNNEEVMFRASTDGGATFSDKINLSNTTDADSWRVEIAGEGDNVIVSWWETTRMTTNQTTTTATANQTEGAAEAAQQDIPVMRVSNDGGQTFGPVLMLATNGTISGTEEDGAPAEGGEGGE